MSRDTENFSMSTAHVDPNQVFLAVEQRLAQSLGCPVCPRRLDPGTGRSQWAYPGRRCPPGFSGWPRSPGGTACSGLHHPLVEDVFQVQQLPLTLHELCHRDACPPLHNPGDLLLGDLVPEQVVLLGPGGIALLLFQLLFSGQGWCRTEAGPPFPGRTPAGPFPAGRWPPPGPPGVGTLPMAFFSFSHLALPALNSSRSSASSF